VWVKLKRRGEGVGVKECRVGGSVGAYNQSGRKKSGKGK